MLAELLDMCDITAISVITVQTACVSNSVFVQNATIPSTSRCLPGCAEAQSESMCCETERKTEQLQALLQFQDVTYVNFNERASAA